MTRHECKVIIVTVIFRYYDNLWNPAANLTEMDFKEVLLSELVVSHQLLLFAPLVSFDQSKLRWQQVWWLNQPLRSHQGFKVSGQKQTVHMFSGV